MRYEYSWNPGVPLQAEFARIDPAAFGHELRRIERVHGKASAPLLALEARNPDHIAHDFIYHVGRARAARLHYERRAGILLRSFDVTVVTEEPRTLRARIALPDPDGDTGHSRYVSTQEVMASDELRALHRASLLRRLSLIQKELRAFDEFAEIVHAIDRAA